MKINDISRFVELFSSSRALPTYPYMDMDERISKAFGSIQDGPTRMSYLSACIVHGCIHKMLPCFTYWRSDTAVRIKLREIANKKSGKEKLDILIFIAVPGDKQLEDEFCTTVREWWKGERASIAEYVETSCGGSGLHDADEMASAHVGMLPYIIRFASFGYYEQFKCIPSIPSNVGPYKLDFERYLVPLIQGEKALQIALEHLLPRHVVASLTSKDKPEETPELSFFDPPEKISSADPVDDATEEIDFDQLHQQLQDCTKALEKRKILKRFGSAILDPKYRSIVPDLLSDPDPGVSGIAARVYLSHCAKSKDPIAAINQGIEISYLMENHSSLSKLFTEFLIEYSENC